ncbi:NAD kinase [Bombiscardovia apis]|uniref:NAD kinase n=1 Tax=Bombiscardovia apis TaxID=2932182 RepID=A0ABM8BCX3_9BIFI|nr:NAD kinase [Bombiscardovia apis]BDR54750.1 NAD kinase [Bombiscardovia apis]
MSERKAVVVTHQRVRSSSIVTEALNQLKSSGFSVSIVDNSEAPAFGEPYQQVDPDTEIVIVLGGDGTILRAAELVKCTGVPILGVNLGHVGFLAEFESFQIGEAMSKVAAHDYSIEERMVAHVDLWLPGADKPLTDWALNDMTLERYSRGKMVEVSLRVDDVEMSSYGCDGIIVATPTGSTAYAFSAGGPIVWPDAQSLQMVPIAAHALFARSLVIGPQSTYTIGLLDDSPSDGWICCDGRRQLLVPKGSRVTVRQSHDIFHLARLSGASFTQRLVSKFDLPVVGWREQHHPNLSAKRGQEARDA